MKALEVREKYADFFVNQGYRKLAEHSVVNENQAGVFFNGSALTPNLDYFLNKDTRPTDHLFTQQRVFLGRSVDELTHLPLFSMFQVMMSFYQFEQPDLQEAFRNGLKMLTEVLGIPRHDLYLLLPKNRPDLLQMVTRAGIDPENIVLWNQAPAFKVDDLLQGFYLKVFLKYKHGVLPIWDLVNIEHNGTTVHVDSCLLLERVTFVLQQKDTWFQTEMFLPLVRSIEDQAGSGVFGDRFGYWLAHMMRSIVCALADGAGLSNKGPGYVMRKTVRRMLKDKLKRHANVTLASLVAPSMECLKRVGYEWDSSQDRIEQILALEESAYAKAHQTAERFLQKQMNLLTSGRRGPFEWEELIDWRDSRGIYEDVALELFARHGHEVQGYTAPSFEQRRLFYSDGYPFPPTETTHNVHDFLLKIEAQ